MLLCKLVKQLICDRVLTGTGPIRRPFLRAFLSMFKKMVVLIISTKKEVSLQSSWLNPYIDDFLRISLTE